MQRKKITCWPGNNLFWGDILSQGASHLFARADAMRTFPVGSIHLRFVIVFVNAVVRCCCRCHRRTAVAVVVLAVVAVVVMPLLHCQVRASRCSSSTVASAFSSFCASPVTCNGGDHTRSCTVLDCTGVSSSSSSPSSSSSAFFSSAFSSSSAPSSADRRAVASAAAVLPKRSFTLRCTWIHKTHRNICP